MASGRVGEGPAPCSIPGHENACVAGPQVVIHGGMATLDPDSGRLQPEVLQRWDAPGGEENLVHLDAERLAVPLGVHHLPPAERSTRVTCVPTEISTIRAYFLGDAQMAPRAEVQQISPKPILPHGRQTAGFKSPAPSADGRRGGVAAQPQSRI